jgi:hypothetical protein
MASTNPLSNTTSTPTSSIPDFKLELIGIPSSIAGDNASFFDRIVAGIPKECEFTRKIAKVYSAGGFDGFVGVETLRVIHNTLEHLAYYEREILELTKDLRGKLVVEPDWKPLQGVVEVELLNTHVTFRSIPLDFELKHDIDYRRVDMIRHHVPQLFPLKVIDRDQPSLI